MIDDKQYILKIRISFLFSLNNGRLFLSKSSLKIILKIINVPRMPCSEINS
ncbi:MAG: hypothetical protein CM15mP14_1910 [Rhodospirillaceae bacterium]|nr:MAG: hypothetical protein CM15mP14_1910 [Rhodospirillaceae bacterium]